MSKLPKSLVVATDFSAPGDNAVAGAIELAAQLDAELYIVHVFAMPVPLLTVYEFALPEPDMRDARELARAKLESYGEQAVAAGVTAHVRLLDGATDKAIVSLARDVDAGWLVVGTHGHTGLQHVLLGSVAERIVRHSPCSVLVVRDERPAES